MALTLSFDTIMTTIAIFLELNSNYGISGLGLGLTEFGFGLAKLLFLALASTSDSALWYLASALA